jgi:hypothetical protein
MFPDHRLILGMGHDNILQLIYWANIEQYDPSNVHSIYAVSRELDKTTNDMVKTFALGDGSTYDFQIKFPWVSESLKARFDNVVEETHNGLGKVIEMKLNPNQEDPAFKFLPPLPILHKIELTPPPASSSLMRAFIKRYFDTGYDENVEKIGLLMFGNQPLDEEMRALIMHTIEEHRPISDQLTEIEKNFAKTDEAFEAYKNEISSAVTIVGGKRSRRKTHKKRNSLKKKKLHKKRKTLRKKKSLKKRK